MLHSFDNAHQQAILVASMGQLGRALGQAFISLAVEVGLLVVISIDFTLEILLESQALLPGRKES